MIYLELFWTFFKIGAFTFGGGATMIPLIQDEVIRKGWIAEKELINFIAISESTPGPFAINVSTYVGTETAGFFGALCSTFGIVLPSLIVIMLVAKFYLAFKENKIVKGCMSGLKPGAVGLIASAVISIGIPVFFPDGFALSTVISPAFICSAVILAITLFMQIKKLHPIIIILASAILGIGFGYLGFVNV
jgi:chromate transporter